MAPRRVGKRWIADFYYARRRFREPSPINTKVGAEEYEAILRMRLAKGEALESLPLAPPPVASFAEFAEEWYEKYVTPNNKRSERETKRVVLRRHLLPAFGRLPLDAVKAASVEAYKAAKLSEGLHPKTINNHLIVLKKCLRTAFEWERLGKTPIIRPIKDVPKPEIDYLTQDESRRLLLDRTEPLWTDMATVALRTGLRRSELLALKKEDANFRTRMLTICRGFVQGELGTPKSTRTRHLPMSSEVFAIMLRAPMKGFVFGRTDGRPHSPDVAEKAIHRLCERAGLRRVGWHALRHTFACELMTLGVPMPQVQELLGHTSITTTMMYIHFAPSVLRGAIDLLEDSLRPPNSPPWALMGKPSSGAPIEPNVLSSIPAVNHN